MEENLVSVEGISFQYPNQEQYALQDVSFSVRKGEWLAIVGHNGSGKSTIAKLLSGLMLPTSGEIRLMDDIMLTEDTVWDFRNHIGMVFQNPDNQFVGTTVKDDVAFGLENKGVAREEMIKRIDSSLSLVNMHQFLDQEPHHLSGGQKQRVAIASILAIEPSIILLDEATSMLDPKGRHEVIQTVNEIRINKHITVISITHDLEEAAKADRIIVLNKGNVFAEGTPSDIFQLDVELEEIGLDIPFPTKVYKLLKDKGLSLHNSPLTEEGLIKELWK
ncbi:energy-coupling factor ABC transporter ATP-binding protein [Bacillus suaedaesalsae]|uniref:Energy-coupling factor ABC transporter ATP-binding protein n=1 Tax=Bacillus suaedaesalsae TaxID=2810349 RepID=A0ABS2DF16_9BACI|nr:energy-coupling factor ABC transporter ATP-binding protein [Bacillus suaedaesalsae]MBM6616166.1 energy-coupling factor ABC transporter ATP-binding protein [Bacillus suaedaesalsae]